MRYAIRALSHCAEQGREFKSQRVFWKLCEGNAVLIDESDDRFRTMRNVSRDAKVLRHAKRIRVQRMTFTE